MIETFKKLVRSYSDALFAGFTKTGADGRRIIYPWGVLGRGYAMPSDDDDERLKNNLAIYIVAVSIATLVGFILAGYVGALVGGALTFAAYAVSLKRLIAHMEPAGERMSLTEAYRAQAIKHGRARLWSWMAVGVFLTCFGIIGSVTVPENKRAIAILAVIGVPMVAFSGWLLVLSRGAPPPAADSTPAKTSVLAEEAAFYVTGDVGPIRAWFITIFGLVFTGLGLAMFIFDAEERLTAAGLTALFGLIAALGISMLVLRRRRLQGH